MHRDVARHICLEQAAGQMGPLHPSTAAAVKAAIGDDPEFAEEVERLREATRAKREATHQLLAEALRASKA